MGSKKYLLDSNVVIDHLGNKLPENSLETLYNSRNFNFTISVISKIEILGHPSVYKIKSVHQFIEEQAFIIQLNEDIISKTIEIRSEIKMKTPDAIIAATAMTNNYSLITRNTKDFKKVKNLEIINPYELNADSD